MASLQNMPSTDTPNLPTEEWEFLRLALLGGGVDPLHPEVAAFASGLRLRTGKFDLRDVRFYFILISIISGLRPDLSCVQVIGAHIDGHEGLLDSHGGAVITGLPSIKPLLDIQENHVAPFFYREKLTQLAGVSNFKVLLTNFLIGGSDILDLGALQKAAVDGVLKLSDEIWSRLKEPGGCAWAFYRAATGKDLVTGDDQEKSIHVSPIFCERFSVPVLKVTAAHPPRSFLRCPVRILAILQRTNVRT
jgi:hypothetical protein